VQRLLQQVRHLDHHERYGAVHRRDAEDVAPFQLGEEPLEARRVSHAPASAA
jgi:hypothetical protein